MTFDFKYQVSDFYLNYELGEKIFGRMRNSCCDPQDCLFTAQYDFSMLFKNKDFPKKIFDRARKDSSLLVMGFVGSDVIREERGFLNSVRRPLDLVVYSLNAFEPFYPIFQNQSVQSARNKMDALIKNGRIDEANAIRIVKPCLFCAYSKEGMNDSFLGEIHISR